MPVGGKERALGVESQFHIGSVEPLPGAVRHRLGMQGSMDQHPAKGRLPARLPAILM